MRNRFAATFYQAALSDPRLSIVVSDISPAGSMEDFRKRFPERFVNVGVAEQAMIGLCAGMALRGLRPFAYTIATFSFYRPFEMVRDDLCYQNVPVTVVGIGGGVTYSTLGSTHLAQEDVALATAIPNMQVLAPCDPEEVHEATLWCARENQGPVYLRLAKAGEPVLTADAVEPWRFGKARYLRRGADVCILSYGPLVGMALKLAERFEATGQRVSVISMHTLKPLDRAGLAQALAGHRLAVVIEEGAPHGGLSSRLKEIAWDEGVQGCRIECFTLKDEFLHHYGDQASLLAEHGLSLAAIAGRLGLPA